MPIQLNVVRDDRPCAVCGDPFTPTRPNAKYCSTACRAAVEGTSRNDHFDVAATNRRILEFARVENDRLRARGWPALSDDEIRQRLALSEVDALD